LPKIDNFFSIKDKMMPVQGRLTDLCDLLIATHNPGKLREISELLAPFGVRAHAPGEFRLTEPEESEATFAGNALLKARAAAAGSGLPALADDSGLEVAALGGAPGVLSARWAGPGRDFAPAMARVESELRVVGARNHSARFVCALALAWPDGRARVFEGEVRGTLVFPGRGAQGFGYDPIFVASGMSQTFGEMAPAAKHAISHRAHAFRKLVDACFKS
jgi:XTP/dITP diphosphohydrolase